MKNAVLLVMATLFAFATIAYAQTVPADKVQIKLSEAWTASVKRTQKGVLFNHETHIAKLNNKCDSCHPTPEGNSKITLKGEIKGVDNKNVAHNFCWTCHDKTPKPNKTPGKTCTKCHVLPK